MIPANSEDLVLSSKCENSDSSISKEHLLFSFIPSKHFVWLPGSLVSYPMTMHAPSLNNIIPGLKLRQKKSLSVN